MTIAKIISGGQTGVDRAALDVALELGIPCGGWCPKGRRAEDGVIPAKYPVQENKSTEYPPRTAMNVRVSDGTLVLTHGEPDRGTALTIGLAKRHKKPFLVVDLDKAPKPAELRKWIRGARIKVLNVAGPRESSCPGIGAEVKRLLRSVFCRPRCS
jgi:predicted Rossmann-fold nucleotide-binding protein